MLKKWLMGASGLKCTVRRPLLTVSETVVPGAMGVWSASVVTVMSASTRSLLALNTLRLRPL